MQWKWRALNKKLFDKKFLFNALLAFAVASIVAFSSQTGFLQRLQLSGVDALFHLRGSSDRNDNVVVIEIDDYDISRVGRWPWSRDWHATMTRALKELGAQSVYFDIIFSEPASDGTDELFQEAIRENENVFLPFVFEDRSFDPEKAFFPIPELRTYIKGTGAINISPDIDGTIRRVPLLFDLPKASGQLPHISLKLAMDTMGYDSWRRVESALVLEDAEAPLRIPLDHNGQMLINWKGTWGETFHHYSFVDVLNAYGQRISGSEPAIDVEPIRDSICLIAVTSIGLYDIQTVPLQPEYPGVGIVATVMSNIMRRSFIRPAPRWTNWLLIYLLSLIPFLFVSGENPLNEIAYVFGIGLLFFLAVLGLFRFGVLVEFTLPIFSFLISYWGVATFHFIRVAVERQRFFNLAITDGLTGTANIRYFMMLLKAECLMATSDDTRHFCIIMSDIDHFKTFNDTYGHKTGDKVLIALAETLKGCVRSSDVVARYGGEEWIVLLRGTGLANGKHVAEKIRKTVETTPVHNPYADKPEDEKLNITLSLGLAHFREGDDENSIIRRADEALYAAKNSGRNRVELESQD